jgi:hypothetical protein
LQALPFRPVPAAVQAVVASVQALALRRRQWRTDRTAFLGRLSTARTSQQVVYRERVLVVYVMSRGQSSHS